LPGEKEAMVDDRRCSPLRTRRRAEVVYLCVCSSDGGVEREKAEESGKWGEGKGGGRASFDPVLSSLSEEEGKRQ
jgi:hypothetical protein